MMSWCCLLESCAEPLLVKRSEKRYGLKVSASSGDDAHNPKNENPEVESEYHQPAQNWDERQDDRRDPACDAGQHQSKRLAKVIGTKFRLLVAVKYDGYDEADQRQIGDDCDGLVVAGG